MKLITWIKVYYRQGEWIWCACCQHAVPACPEMSVVGRIIISYKNCLPSIGWSKHAVTIVLTSTINLTHKIWEILLWEQEVIKSWNFRTIPNIVTYILKNPVNSYDSNGVISVPISTLRDKKRNLRIFCLPIFPRNPLNVSGHIIRRWKDNYKENTAPLE